MGSNRSMAVWCKRLPGANTKVEFEFHFNYWCIQNEVGSRLRPAKISSKADFAEIGLMIKNPDQVAEVALYIPANIDRGKITDCAPLFEIENVVQGIFNEQLSVVAPPLAPLEFKHANGRRFAAMHRFAAGVGSEIAGAELDVQPTPDGTLCRIMRPVFQAAGTRRTYFRLRIEMPRDRAGNPFVELVEIPDFFLLSAHEEIEYLDFRLNEARTLPTYIEAMMAAEQPADSVQLKLVAFLTAVPVKSAVSAANSEFHKMRLLEDAIWSRYSEGIPRGMLVYHWKKVSSQTKPIADFSAFVKLQTRRSGPRVLATYLLFAFLFGVFGNIFAGLLQGCVAAMLVWIGAVFTHLTGYLPWFALPLCGKDCAVDV